MIYDPWGNPEIETYMDMNLKGMDGINNFTGYTYDEVLDLYFAQNRFYDPVNRRFIQEDKAKDGDNWYVYCDNNPLTNVDWTGCATYPTWYTFINNYNNGIKNSSDAIPYFIPNSVTYKYTVASMLNELAYTGKGAISATKYIRYDGVWNYGVKYNIGGNSYGFQLYQCGNVVYNNKYVAKAATYQTNTFNSMRMTRADFCKYMGIGYNRNLGVSRVKDDKTVEITLDSLNTGLLYVQSVNPYLAACVQVLRKGVSGFKFLYKYSKLPDGLYVSFYECCQIKFNVGSQTNYTGLEWYLNYRVENGLYVDKANGTFALQTVQKKYF